MLLSWKQKKVNMGKNKNTLEFWIIRLLLQTIVLFATI